jgi:hypothetical protein
MKTITVDINELPSINLQQLKVNQRKSGSRTEYLIEDITPYEKIGQTILQKSDQQILPLRYASIIKASQATRHQEFHRDSGKYKSIRVFIYLTDVTESYMGAIEFEDGPVLGPKGTAVIYSSENLHRGVANTTANERWALALAFCEQPLALSTFGAEPTVLPNEKIVFQPGLTADFYELPKFVSVGSEYVPLKDISDWGSYITTVENVIVFDGNLIPTNPTHDDTIYVGMLAKGWIFVNETTDITIKITPDDGADVYIDDTSVFNTSASWGTGDETEYTSRTITLTPGLHGIKFWYYQRTGGINLTFTYKLNDLEYTNNWNNILYSTSRFQPMQYFGQYSEARPYYINDMIAYGGKTYVCTSNNVHVPPDEDDGVWFVIGTTTETTSKTTDNNNFLIFIFVILIFVVVYVCLIFFPQTFNNHRTRIH